MTSDSTQKAVDSLTKIVGSPHTYPRTSFAASTEAVLAAIPAVGDTERPLVTLLQSLADELDTNGVGNAQMVNQYRLTLNVLLQRSPKESTVDEDEAFLNGL